MAVQVEKDGWKVSGDTLEELEIGIAAVQRALVGSLSPAKRGPGRPPGKTQDGKAAAMRNFAEHKEATLAILRTISGARTGVTADDLVSALKLKHARALGSPMGLANRILEGLQFKPTTVYVAKKEYNEPKRYYPKARIEEAIEAVENMEE